MTRAIRVLLRRGLAATALATFAVALTAGCGAGQQAQTAGQVPAVPGANAEVRVPDPEGGRLLVRNAVVVYTRNGYAKGANAPLELRLYNETPKPMRLVEVTSPSGRVLAFTGVSTAPGGTASPTPPTTGSPSPTATRAPSPTATRAPPPTATRAPPPTATRPPAAAGRPVNLEVPARGYLVLSPNSGQFLQIVGLAEPLRLGQTVKLTFRFSNGATITNVAVPLTTPTSPVPRSPLVFTEGGAGHD